MPFLYGRAPMAGPAGAQAEETSARAGAASLGRRLVSALLVALSGSVAVALPAAASGVPTPQSAAHGTHLAAARADGDALLGMAQAILSNPGRRAQLAAGVAAVASARQAELLALAQSDPAVVPSLVLPASILAVLRPVAGGALERGATLSGRLSVRTLDPTIGDDHVTTTLTTPSGDVALAGYGLVPAKDIGGEATVSGYAIANTLVAMEYGSSVTTSGSSTGAQTPLGPLNVAVILANFSNSTTSLDPSVAKATFEGSPGNDVDSWYSANSYGASTLNPSFFGPFTISDAAGSGSSCPDLTTAGNDLMSAASSSITYSQYRRIMLVFNCTGYGASTNIGETQITTPQGVITGGLTYLDANGLGKAYTYAHELGHNLGNYHAGFFLCAPSSFVPPTRFGQNCTSVEYGNEFDTMGTTVTQPQATPELDAWHKNNAGWFGPGNFVTLSSPGTYTYKLLPYETATSGLLALDIPRGNSGTSFTLEYRQPIGFDSWMTTSNSTYCSGQCTATEGPLINFVYGQNGAGGGSDTQAIDTTPDSIQSSSFYPVQDDRDGALLPGKTFTDPEYGISVSTVSADATGATVTITVPSSAACVHGTPSVALQGPTAPTTTPGASVTYVATVTDTDSSGCPSSEFKYSGGTFQVANGNGALGQFDTVAAPDVLTMAPGTSANVSLTVTPAAATPDGTYSFPDGQLGTVAANPVSVPVVNVPAASLTLASAADTTPPSAPTGVSATALGSGVASLSWSAAADNIGVIGYRIVVDNSVQFLSAGGPFVDDSLTAGTTHSFAVQAYDQQGNMSPAATVSLAMGARTDTSAPSVPGTITGSASDRSVTLSWYPSADNIGVAGYVVSPGNVWVPAGTTRTTVSGLDTQTPYTFHVQAVDGAGNMSPYQSGGLTVTTAAAGTVAPSTPTGLYAPSATGPSGIQLTWGPSSDPAGVTGYNVFRNGRLWTTVSGTGYTDPSGDLFPGAGYQYAVQAVDSSGNVSAVTAVLQTIAPQSGSTDSVAPTGAALTSPSNGAAVSGAVTLSTSPSDNVGVTWVDFFVDGTYVTRVASAPFTYSWNTTTTFSGPHALYARAYDAAGNFATSAVTTVTVGGATAPPADTTPPTTPANLTASAGSPTQVNLSWGAATDGDLAGYRVYRGGTLTATVTGTSWSDTTVAASTTYSYDVVAYDGAGNVSAASNTASVTTPAPPGQTSQTGSISGTVTHASKILANVKIAVVVGGRKYSYFTGSAGTYTIPNLPAGTYTLTFSLKGYKNVSVTVSVTAGQNTTANVSM